MFCIYSLLATIFDVWWTFFSRGLDHSHTTILQILIYKMLFNHHLPTVVSIPHLPFIDSLKQQVINIFTHALTAGHSGACRSMLFCQLLTAIWISWLRWHESSRLVFILLLMQCFSKGRLVWMCWRPGEMFMCGPGLHIICDGERWTEHRQKHRMNYWNYTTCLQTNNKSSMAMYRIWRFVIQWCL